ncbi:MAG: tRNA-dihydrouridine synthase family protein [Spirochaetota bacterium]
MNPLIIAGVDVGRYFLAPLAGFSDFPFRRRARAFGADLVYTEMVSAAALARRSKKTYRYTEHRPDESPIALQLFGGVPEDFARAVSLNDFSSFDFIDINMGCPVKKVTRTGGGASLLSDIERMHRIVTSVRENTAIPVCVKIRLGDRPSEGGEIERLHALIDAGAVFIAVHARYRTEMFGGTPHWDTLAKIVEASSVPIIANGDILTAGDVTRVLSDTKAAAVMIGRGAIGKPWIFRELRAAGVPPRTTADEIKTVMRLELADMVELYGPAYGVKEFRKHFVKFLRNFRITREERTTVLRLEDQSGVLAFIDTLEGKA